MFIKLYFIYMVLHDCSHKNIDFKQISQVHQTLMNHAKLADLHACCYHTSNFFLCYVYLFKVSYSYYYLYFKIKWKKESDLASTIISILNKKIQFPSVSFMNRKVYSSTLLLYFLKSCTQLWSVCLHIYKLFHFFITHFKFKSVFVKLETLRHCFKNKSDILST